MTVGYISSEKNFLRILGQSQKYFNYENFPIYSIAFSLMILQMAQQMYLSGFRNWFYCPSTHAAQGRHIFRSQSGHGATGTIFIRGKTNQGNFVLEVEIISAQAFGFVGRKLLHFGKHRLQNGAHIKTAQARTHARRTTKLQSPHGLLERKKNKQET